LSNEIKNKVGSGAIEKNIELVIGRRFKKWGMRWSKDGANYLLKLRILKHDREAWNDFWKNNKSHFHGRKLPFLSWSFPVFLVQNPEKAYQIRRKQK